MAQRGTAFAGTDNLGGKGAFVSGTVDLVVGDKLAIMVGQSGVDSGTSGGSGGYNDDQAGGGGGSFVFEITQTVWNDKDNVILAAAGGGGGGGTATDGEDGQATTSGGNNGGNAGLGTNGGENGETSLVFLGET